MLSHMFHCFCKGSPHKCQSLSLKECKHIWIKCASCSHAPDLVGRISWGFVFLGQGKFFDSFQFLAQQLQEFPRDNQFHFR